MYDILLDLAVFFVVSITKVVDLSICVLSICISVTRFSIQKLKGLMEFVFVSKKVLCCGQ